MAPDVYSRLREQLDQYAVGFPLTKSGVEFKILRKLFREEEAELFLLMSMMLETPGSLAERTRRDPGEVAALLQGMAEKGLIFCHRKGDQVKYAALPYIVGFFELQLKRMDRELAQLMEEYFEEALAPQAARQTAMMRTIPVNRAVPVSYQVAPHDDACKIIASNPKIVVADCICRLMRGHLEEACDKPLEVCFMFGAHADYYLERGMGRSVSQEEALAILEQCEKAGLVTQPFNAVNPGGMCNCCGDCCGILRALKKHPQPKEVLVSSYYAQVEPAECTACETCLDRCQMEAVRITDDQVAQVDLDRCIGCGLCVTTCQTGAMRLVLKAEEQRPKLPASGAETYLRLAQRRGTSLVPLALRK